MYSACSLGSVEKRHVGKSPVKSFRESDNVCSLDSVASGHGIAPVNRFFVNVSDSSWVDAHIVPGRLPVS